MTEGVCAVKHNPFGLFLRVYWGTLHLMKLLPVFLCTVVSLGACAPLTIYHKQGATVSRMQSDTRACRVKALRDVPVNTQIRTTPARYIPQRRVCDASGNNCELRGGYFIPGEVYSFDASKGLRAEVETACMARRGYAPVSIPPCPGNVAQAAKPARTNRLPALTPKSCAIRNQDGSFQIVNRG